MHCMLFDPDVIIYKKRLTSLSLRSVFLILSVHACKVYSLILMLLGVKKLSSLSLRSVFLMVSVHVCQVYPFLLMLLLLIAV